MHAIYALVYTMCTNKIGLLGLKTYFLAEDKQIFEPIFIAQYLLVPVNTIVKNTLLPWMMRSYSHLEVDDKVQSKRIKAEVFLRYTLLTKLMSIVYTYGRNPDYDFASDERLAKILNGRYGLHGKTDKKHVLGAFDSFLTIWLLTLLEKFEEWFQAFKPDNQKKYPETKIMNFNQYPIFPYFSVDTDSTELLALGREKSMITYQNHGICFNVLNII